MIQLLRPLSRVSEVAGVGVSTHCFHGRGCCIYMGDGVGWDTWIKNVGSGTFWKGPERLGSGIAWIQGWLNEGD